MKRQGKTISFTEEDRKNFCVRRYSDLVISENVKRFRASENRRRLRFSALALVMLGCMKLLPTIKYLLVLCFAVSLFIFLINEYAARININSAKREYFIEFEVIEKLEREIFTEGVLQGSPHSSFYPVIGRDITTGYISKIYLDRWEDHVLAKEGNVMRLTIGKEKL